MPDINEILLYLEGFSLLRHLILARDAIISYLARTQVTYVLLFSLGENIIANF